MAENTKIEWAHHTFNPWIGCQKVGPGCDHCYAETWDARFEGVRWGPHAQRTRTKEANWTKVRRWNRKAGEAGIRERVFVASLADICDTHSSIKTEWRSDLAELVCACENLDFLFLTKRAGNITSVLSSMFPEGIPQNLWMGITIVNQEEADRDIIKLLKAKQELGLSIAFLSMEPLLGPVDLAFTGARPENSVNFRLDALRGVWMGRDHLVSDHTARIDWVIVGGESGADARPMDPAWVRALRDQCQEAGTPFLFKQWGEWFAYGEIDAQGRENSRTRGEDPTVWHAWPEGGFSVRLGKAQAGRHLDGVTHDAVPEGRYHAA